jgi:hypothetical protein
MNEEQVEAEIAHIQELISKHRNNLRQYQKQAADYGASDIPIPLRNKIESEQKTVDTYDRALTVLQYQLEELQQQISATPQKPLILPPHRSSKASYEEVDEVYSAQTTEVAPSSIYQTSDENPFVLLGETLFDPYARQKLLAGIAGFAVICGILLFAVSSCAEANAVKLRDDFIISDGLGSWRSQGVISVVPEDRASASSDPQLTPRPNNYNGSVQVDSGAVLYRFIANNNSLSDAFLAKAWCKAPLNSECVLFLGRLEEGMNKRDTGNNQIIKRAGTGQWESMQVEFEPKDRGGVYVFMYVIGGNSSANFDNIEVRQTR